MSGGTRTMAPRARTDAGLAHAVGRLEGQIEALKDELAHDRDERRHEEAGARQHRKDLRDVIGALTGAVKTLSDKVTEAEPLWSDYQEKRAEARGAAKLIKFIYLTVAAAAGVAGSALFSWLKH